MDAEALAKVLYEAHGSWRSPELSHWEAASSEPDVRALYLHMAEAALRALAPPAQAVAPASEVGDREKAEQIARDVRDVLYRPSVGEPFGYAEALLNGAADLIAQALATERAAALERAAQVAEQEIERRIAESDTATAEEADYYNGGINAVSRVVSAIRALIPAPEPRER